MLANETPFLLHVSSILSSTLTRLERRERVELGELGLASIVTSD